MDNVNPSKNQPWQSRSLQSVWHPCTQMARSSQVPPLPIASGAGPWLTDYEGKRYFDCISSWWTNLFGHCDADMNAAVAAQLQRLPHTMLAGCTHAPAVELGEQLRQLTGDTLGHVFFASDGACAVEIALKMSFHYWRNTGQPQKREFVCLQQSYHGETIGALAVTDIAIFRDQYGPLLMQSHLVATPDARQAQPGESAADVALRAAADLERLLSQRSEHIAAVILEPLIQCAAGMALYDPCYLREVRRLCDAYHVHLIADEIAVGCGRTGRFFAFEHAQQAEDATAVWPDFMCLSKGISGGYLPLALVLTRDEIYQAFWHDEVKLGFLHSHSYSGNPLACAAALEVLRRFATEDVLQANVQRALWMDAALAPLQADERLAHFRHIGMVWAFDVRAAYLPERFAEIFHMLGRTQGLIIRPIGNTVYLLPPYAFDAETAQWLGSQVLRTLDLSLQDRNAATTPEPATA